MVGNSSFKFCLYIFGHVAWVVSRKRSLYTIRNQGGRCRVPSKPQDGRNKFCLDY